MFIDRIVPLFIAFAIILFGLMLFKLPVLGLLKLLIPIFILIVGIMFLIAVFTKN